MKRKIVKSGLASLIAGVSLLAPAFTHAQVPVPRVKPAPPGPVWLSPSDYNLLNGYFDALDDKSWSEADSWRQRLADPVARSIAAWAWYKYNTNGLDFRAAGRYLEANPDWPNESYIQSNAEKRMRDSDKAADILAFFANRNPETGNGKLQLARAWLETGAASEGKRMLREAWVQHDWSAQQEAEFRTKWGQYLTPADHMAKADRQLFQIKASATTRLLNHLTADDRRRVAARIALLRRDANAETLFRNLTEDDRKDAGVLHAAVRYFRRGDQESEAIFWAARAPLNGEMLRNPDRWWTEKRILSRWALKNGRFDDAYALAAYSGLTSGGSFSDAEFTAGWIALRFLQDPDRALPHFAFLDAGVTAPISKARAHYWLGRTFDAKGETARAQQHYAVSAAWPYTYYGQLAWEKLEAKDAAPRFPAPVTPTDEDRALFEARPLVHATRILAELDRDREHLSFARALDDELTTPGEYAAYEELMIAEGKPYLSVRAGKVAVSRGAGAPSVSYPLVQVPDQAAEFAEKALILALSRQESEFNPRAFSSANARGMMQLLPSTAKITARKEGLPYSRSRLLDDPTYNMVIGAAHLSHLLDRFNGSYVLTLAGYNAGPHRSESWIDDYGDPRSHNVDPVDWVELIPFSETRNYVMRVMENVQIYRAQIEDREIPGRLAADLTRGGGSMLAIGQNPPSPFLDILARQQKDLQNTDYGTAKPAAFQIAYRPPEASVSFTSDGAIAAGASVDSLSGGSNSHDGGRATLPDKCRTAATGSSAEALNSAELEDVLAAGKEGSLDC